MVNKLLIKLKRAYHRWCLKNAIAKHYCDVTAYHASTNSYTARNRATGTKYHVYVTASGEIRFVGIVYE